jgi:hypothetical protein
MIAGVTVGHDQEVGEGMTIPTMESVGNITAACVVSSGRYLLPLVSSVDWPMMQVVHTKSRATRHTINSLWAGHKTTHKIMTTGTRMTFKPKNVWSLANLASTSSSWA